MLAHGPHGLRVLPAPQNSNRRRQLSADDYTAVIDCLRRHVGIIVIDLGTDMLEGPTVAALKAAHQLIVVSNDDWIAGEQTAASFWDDALGSSPAEYTIVANDITGSHHAAARATARAADPRARCRQHPAQRHRRLAQHHRLQQAPGPNRRMGRPTPAMAAIRPRARLPARPRLAAPRPGPALSTQRLSRCPNALSTTPTSSPGTGRGAPRRPCRPHARRWRASSGADPTKPASTAVLGDEQTPLLYSDQARPGAARQQRQHPQASRSPLRGPTGQSPRTGPPSAMEADRRGIRASDHRQAADRETLRSRSAGRSRAGKAAPTPSLPMPRVGSRCSFPAHRRSSRSAIRPRRGS